MSIGWKITTRLASFALMLVLWIAGEQQLNGQVYQPTELEPDEAYENVHVKKVYSDSNTSVFVIWVKKSVAKHYHAHHTEYVEILEGAGEFWLNGLWHTVEAGDDIIIPAGSPHEVRVTSAVPMKVVSIQTPEFLGVDRIYVED